MASAILSTSFTAAFIFALLPCADSNENVGNVHAHSARMMIKMKARRRHPRAQPGMLHDDISLEACASDGASTNGTQSTQNSEHECGTAANCSLASVLYRDADDSVLVHENGLVPAGAVEDVIRPHVSLSRAAPASVCCAAVLGNK